MVSDRRPVAVRINLRDSRRESSGVRASRGDLFAYTHGGSRAAHSPFRHIEVAIRSELEATRVVEPRRENAHICGWTLRAGPRTPALRK